MAETEWWALARRGGRINPYESKELTDADVLREAARLVHPDDKRLAAKLKALATKKERGDE